MSRLVFTGSIPVLHKNKNIWSRHLVKQLWPPDRCRRTEGRLSTTIAAKGCLLSTQQERALSGLIQVNDDEERKGGQAAIGTLGYPIWAYTNDWEQWVWCILSVRHPGLIPVYQKNSCTPLFSCLRSPWAAGILSTLFAVWM